MEDLKKQKKTVSVIQTKRGSRILTSTTITSDVNEVDAIDGRGVLRKISL